MKIKIADDEIVAGEFCCSFDLMNQNLSWWVRTPVRTERLRVLVASPIIAVDGHRSFSSCNRFSAENLNWIQYELVHFILHKHIN